MIDRKKAVEDYNQHVLEEFRAILDERTNDVEDSTQDHHNAIMELSRAFQHRVEQLTTNQVLIMDELVVKLQERIATFESDMKRLESTSRNVDDQMADITIAIARVKDDLRSVITDQSFLNRDLVSSTLQSIKQELEKVRYESRTFVNNSTDKLEELKQIISSELMDHHTLLNKITSELAASSEQEVCT